MEKINRGGLVYPSEEIYLTCLAAWNFYEEIREQKDAKDFLFEQSKAKEIFVESLLGLCESSSGFLSISCDNGHTFQRSFCETAGKMFSIFARNLCTEVNSVIHQEKKRKLFQQKVIKLQSQS